MGHDLCPGDACHPKRVRPGRTFDFSKALEHLKDGVAVSRAGWNRPHFIAVQYPDSESANTVPYIYIVVDAPSDSDLLRHRHDTKKPRVPWVASQVDLLATDWYIVSPK